MQHARGLSRKRPATPHLGTSYTSRRRAPESRRHSRARSEGGAGTGPPSRSATPNRAEASAAALAQRPILRRRNLWNISAAFYPAISIFPIFRINRAAKAFPPNWREARAAATTRQRAHQRFPSTSMRSEGISNPGDDLRTAGEGVRLVDLAHV